MSAMDADDVYFARSLGLEVGVDVDDDLPQGHHLCWPYGSYQGALCETNRLWGHSSLSVVGQEVDCAPCVKVLRRLRLALPTVARKVIAKLAENVRSLDSIYSAASDALWILDRPKEAEELNVDGAEKASSFKDPWKTVREAMEAHDAFHASQFSHKPEGKRGQS